MDRICNVCGSVLTNDEKFCTNCGSPVPEDVNEAVQQSVNEAVQETQAVDATPQDSNAQQAYTTPQDTNAQQAYTAPQDNNAQQAYTAPQDFNAQQAYTAPQDAYVAPPNNYYDPQGGYSVDMNAVPEKKDPVGLGVAALILGIISLLISCCGGGLLFGWIAAILGIIFAIKAKKKAMGIIGAILGGLSLLISLVMVIIAIAVPSSFIQMLTNAGIDTSQLEQILTDPDNFDLTTEDNGYSWLTEDTEDNWSTEDTSGSYEVSGTPSSMDQIRIADTIYQLPCPLNQGLYVVTDYTDDPLSTAEKVEEIKTQGLPIHSYKYVMLRDDNYNYFFGFIQNEYSDMEYSLDNLVVTGIDVDTYSLGSYPETESYGGVNLYMNQSAVEILLGSPDDISDNRWTYKADDGSVSYFFWFDNEMVDEMQISYFYDWER